MHGSLSTRTIVLGTHNRKKGIELTRLLGRFGFQIKTLGDFPNSLEIIEDGQTFAANARLKATGQARHLREWTLGEDSGLAVYALDGAPGIYSARFSGADATDARNNQFLLERLRDVRLSRRTAHYVCHVTLSDPEGHVRAESEATCSGRIALHPAGHAGFGYDPLCEIVEYHRTFGQLGDTVKSVLSHRGRAIRRFVPQLLHILRSGQWD